MKTSSIVLQTLSVPCACRCRYCLLSWDGRTVGCDFEKSRAYAAKFHEWIQIERPSLRFHFSFGYSMDHPELLRAVDFMNSIGSVSGRFLQMNGFAFRSDEDSKRLMRSLRSHGVESVNFTFYGLSAEHDRFAGRKGDFPHLLNLASAAIEAGLSVSAGIPVTQENCGQTDELLSVLKSRGVSELRLFVPHEEGRGALLSGVRLTAADYERLSPEAKARFNRSIYRTEAEWLSETELKEDTERMLLISLTPENISRFEEMGFEAVIRYVEELDEAYYRAVPDFRSLLTMYADVSGTRLYGKRDLFQHYLKRFLADYRIEIYDVTDERQCGSRRF